MMNGPMIPLLSFLAAFQVASAQLPVLDGITFASKPDSVFLPIREVGEALQWPVHSAKGRIYLADKKVWIKKRLFDGTNLFELSDLQNWGAHLTWDDVLEQFEVTVKDKSFVVTKAAKRVEISKHVQHLRAWQGQRLILVTRVSTGAKGHTTPSGSFVAGPEKSVFRRSALYDDAPMPWAVQVHGNIFMHGYPSVPRRPASHGCIRLPLTGKNPAKWLFGWVEVGTPIEINNEKFEVDVR